MKNKKNIILYISIVSVFLICLCVLPIIAKALANKMDGDLVVAKLTVNFLAFLLFGILMIIFNRDFKKAFFNLSLFFVLSIYFQATLMQFNIKGFWKNNLISLIPDILICMILIVINRKLLKNKLKDFITNFKQYFNLTLKYWLCGCLLMILSNMIISLIFGGMPINEAENRKLLTTLPLYYGLSTIILTPLTEELAFRVAFKKCFKDSNLFALVTAIIFAFFHVFVAGDYHFAIPYAFLGFFFGKIYYDTDNIYTSIFMHSIHNITCLLLIIIEGII